MIHGLARAVVTFVFPGGILFVAGFGFLRPQGLPSWCQTPVAALPYLSLAFGLVFGWYFASTRMLLSLLTLTFAQQAIAAWPPEADPRSVTRTVFAASAFLLPLNFLTLSLVKEQAIGSLWGVCRMLPFLLQPFIVWWLCEAAQEDIATVFTTAYLPQWSTAWTAVPQPALLVFLIATVLLVVRFALRRRPMDAGAIWALASTFLAYHATQFGWSPANFFATAGLIVFSSLLQAVYQETYHDELTGIPGRTAYEEATAQLDGEYAMGVLAIDQLKAYAGAHGKPVSEQILKLVARRVQAACEAGRVFRVSGEELNLLFARQSALQALAELETIRKRVASTVLILRGGHRITEVARETASAGGKNHLLPITASIGVADTLGDEATRSEVIKAAYRALYEAKAAGGDTVKRGVVARISFRRSSRHPVAS